MSVVGTGVFLTEDEVKRLREHQSTPLITGYSLIGPPSMEKVLYDICLAKGMPEIPGWYGLDQTRSPPEVTRWEEP